MVSHIGFVFQIACCFLSIYYVLLFCIQYGENADANLTTVKKFNTELQDKYPTFSFCFSGTKFHWFNDLNIFQTYGLSSIHFEQMLKGESAIRYEKNHSTQLYNKIPTFLANGSIENFDKMHLKPSDILKDVKFSYKNAENNVKSV